MTEGEATTYAAGRPDGKPDPTGNVLQLVEAAVTRLNDLATAGDTRNNDLRAAESRYNDLRDAHQREIANLRDTHARAMNDKESSRLDSIRQIDREEGNQKAIAAQQAITTLANSTIALKDTLQLQVQNTAVVVENKQAAFQKDVNDRISKLELTGSEGKGKSGVRDPVLDDLLRVVNQLSSQQTSVEGKSTGMRDMGGWIVAGIVVVVTIAGVVVAVISRGQ